MNSESITGSAALTAIELTTRTNAKDLLIGESLVSRLPQKEAKRIAGLAGSDPITPATPAAERRQVAIRVAKNPPACIFRALPSLPATHEQTADSLRRLCHVFMATAGSTGILVFRKPHRPGFRSRGHRLRARHRLSDHGGRQGDACARVCACQRIRHSHCASLAEQRQHPHRRSVAVDRQWRDRMVHTRRP